MEENNDKKKGKTTKRIINIIIIIILLLLFWIIWFYFSKLNKINYVSVPPEEIEKSDEVEEKLKGYKNIVLFGINDDEKFTGRTGCMIIASLNQETDEVKLTSIYSDTYVEIPGHGFNKASNAYELGGPSLAMSTLNRNFDLNITEYITINFNTIKDVVDALDGVKVTISQKEANQIRGISKAGTYTLNGSQVHDYQKIILNSSHEFVTERMRTILTAAAKRAKETSLISLNNALDILLPQIETNISKTEITKMLTKVFNIKIINSQAIPYDLERKTIKGESFGISKTLETNVEKLHENIFDEENYETTNTVKEISEKNNKKCRN